MRRALIVVALFTLSACGSPGPDQPRVATMASDPATASAAADVENQRPLIRADTTDDEINKLLNVYTRCLRDHGVPGRDTGHGNWKPTVEQESGEHQAAFRACRVKEPEPAMERLKRQDFAEYADRYHAFVKCVQDAGVGISPVDNGPSIKFKHDADAFSDRVTSITENCQKTTEFQ